MTELQWEFSLSIVHFLNNQTNHNQRWYSTIVNLPFFEKKIANQKHLHKFKFRKWTPTSTKNNLRRNFEENLLIDPNETETWASNGSFWINAIILQGELAEKLSTSLLS